MHVAKQNNKTIINSIELTNLNCDFFARFDVCSFIFVHIYKFFFFVVNVSDVACKDCADDVNEDVQGNRTDAFLCDFKVKPDLCMDGSMILHNESSNVYFDNLSTKAYDIETFLVRNDLQSWYSFRRVTPDEECCQASERDSLLNNKFLSGNSNLQAELLSDSTGSATGKHSALHGTVHC